MAAGYESERTEVGTVPGALGLGLMTSEVNRKRKSSGYVSTGRDRSTHDSFPRACLFLQDSVSWANGEDSGPLQSSVSFQFWLPISAPAPSLY